MASGVAELLGLLLRLEWGENEDRQRSLALVLVKRRCTAVYLAEYLNSCPELMRKLVRTTYIVGHGNGGTDRGEEEIVFRCLSSFVASCYYLLTSNTTSLVEG